MVPAVTLVITLVILQFNRWPGWRVTGLIFGLNLIITFTFTLVFNVIFHWATPPLFARSRSRPMTVAVYAVAVVAGVLVSSEIALRIIELIRFDAISWWPEIGEMRGNLIRFGFVVTVTIVLIAVSYERLRDRTRKSEERAEAARREALHARLEALRARTNPHFLFNSLNSVAGLIEEDPRKAERILEKLSGLLRFTLDGSRRERVTLAEELHAVRSYLEVEEVRYGARLRCEIEVDPAAEGLAVPPLVLQPLVENAVLHGVARRREGGRVWVRAARERDALVLTVEDDGPGPGNSSHAGTRTSMADLGNRLRLAYGDTASLDTGAGGHGGYLVTVRIPAEAAA